MSVPQPAQDPTAVAPSAPTISVLLPAFGSTGGSSVAIFGSNLQTVTSVTFGGAPAAEVVHNALGLTVTAPPHAPGNVVIVVTNQSGSATANYAYIGLTPGPSVASISPGSGPSAGGTYFQIKGNVLTGATVRFNGIPATNVTVNASGTIITGTVPAGAVGNATVTVTTPAGTAQVFGGYSYTSPVQPPTASSISPASGSATGGTSFTITGTNLSGASVAFNGVPATGVTVNGAGTSLTGTTPAGTVGNATVVVFNPAGAVLVPGGYSYTSPVQPPTASSISPASGSATGGTSFTITGTNLSGASVT
ncbi:IPT/TIG domain-containing protein, partial [Streptomyces kronopolitis]|uniref:IPT/TIG domain-containing protein n=1 Tax=Streptomyces kronopolitis TaxID=1612435 RepID=UPI0037B44F7E